MFRRVVVGGFVQKLCGIAGHQKAMRKACRYPELLAVVFAQLHAHPLPEGGGALADIHRHIKYRPAHHAHQLALGLLDLIMQAAQHALGAAAVVVLHKVQVQAGGMVEGFLVEAFEEETTGVAEHFGFDDEYVWNGGGGDFHAGGRSVSGVSQLGAA